MAQVQDVIASAPTSLLDHPDDGSSSNCLALALGAAQDVSDDIVFLSGADDAADIGHVILRDRATRLVRDPAGSAMEANTNSVEAYAKLVGRQILAIVSASLVRGLLRTPAASRARRLADIGGPLERIGHLSFAAVGSVTPPPQPQSPPSGPVGGSVQDGAVHAWLNALGNSVSDGEKTSLAQQGDDATTLLKWFNDHSRGDPKLNDMPQNIADAESRLLADPTASKGIQVNGLITRDALKDFVGGIDKSARSMERDKSTPVGTPMQDSDVHNYLDSLGGAVSDSDKASLAQTADDTKTLSNWFNAHDRGDPALNDMPQAVQDADNRLQSDDAVSKRIEVNGVVTRDALGSFLGDLEGSAKSAKDSWGSFQKDNKTPDASATQEAVDASILQANMPILDAAGSASAKVDGKINMDDLKAVASTDSKMTLYVRGEPKTTDISGAQTGANSHLSPALANAAAFYVNQGEFSGLSNEGLDPATVSDGTVNNNNFKTLLSSDTSKSEDGTISGLRSAALQSVSAGGDPSKVNADYYKDPSSSTASGADKLAALVQLSKTIGRYNAGQSTYQENGPDTLSSPEQYHETWGDGPTPGEQRDAFVKDVQSRIDTLGQDKDVQALLSDKMPAALQGLVGSDPSLKASLQKQFDASSSTAALQAAFTQKDSSGNPLSTTAALSSFETKPNFYAQALGITPDYSKAFDAAPQDLKDKITQSYGDITSGKEIADLTKAGTPQDQALIQSAAHKTIFDSVLDKATVQDGTDKFSDTTSALGRAQITDGKSGDDLLAGLGITSEDDPKLEQIIQDNLNTLAPLGQDQASASDVLKDVRNIVDLMRQGLKFDDAVAKVGKGLGGDGKPIITGPASDAYKSGAMHAASAVLLAGGLAARISGGQSSTVATVQQSLSVAGLLTEGGAKFYGGLDGRLKTAIANDERVLANLQTGGDQSLIAIAQSHVDRDKASLASQTNIGKDVESVGKSVGGVAGNALGFITGIIGAAQASANGDIGGAAAQGIFAGLNGISTVATTAEVAAQVIPRVAGALGTELAADAPALAGLIGGVAGVIGGIAGGLAAVGGLIYAIVSSIQADEKKEKSENAWYKELQDGFAPSGVALPDLGTLISAPNGYVDMSNPPVEE